MTIVDRAKAVSAAWGDYLAVIEPEVEADVPAWARLADAMQDLHLALADAQTSGLDLAVLRLRAKLRVLDIASQMGVSASYVSQIERQPQVTLAVEERYRQAVDMAQALRAIQADTGQG